MSEISAKIKKRLMAYGFTFFLMWPLISLIMSTIDSDKAKGIEVPIGIAFLASFGGTLLLMGDFIIVGIILAVPCIVIFSVMDYRKLITPLDHRFILPIEPILLFGSCFFALLLHYPALLNYPILFPMKNLPVWLGTFIIGVIVTAFSAAYASRGNRVKVPLAIIMIGFFLVSFAEVCRSYQGSKNSLDQRGVTVLFGIDSLSYADDLSEILSWAKANQGTPYQFAVTPGLLTNSVWTSLITTQPIDQHKVFHSFQSGYPKDGKTIVDLARRAGCRTISIFPDQFSCWIGSETDFDVHLDGPIGWRQIATTSIENMSLLLPLIRPLLPEIPFSCVPKNHIGTYNYDLKAGLDGIFSHEGKTFVASHHTYIHTNRYPKYSELNGEEIIKVLKSKISKVIDTTFDWQHTDSTDDPIQIRTWKVAHLQKNVIASMERTGFLRNGGRLVIFSDHGDRANLNNHNFTNPSYHHVIFITFGLPVYSDPNCPVSLMDIPGIIGLKKYSKSPPVVEFTLSEPSEWSKLIQSAKLGWNGTVKLDRDLLSDIFKGLKSHTPYSISAPDFAGHAALAGR